MDGQYDDSYPVQQPMVLGGHTSDSALQTHIDAREIINNVNRALNCEVEVIDKNGNVQFQRIGSPILSQDGINRILAQLQSRLNKIFIFSDLEKENVENITIKVGAATIDLIYFNWETYGIKSTADASLVIDIVTDTVYATLRKGYMGGYLKFLRTTSNISEVQHRQVQATERVPPDSSGGSRLFSRFFGGRKR